MITSDEVKKLANLAHLAVDDDKTEQLAQEMEAILAYVDSIKTIAPAKEQATHKPDRYNVVRVDEVTNEPGEYTEAIVTQFPDQDGTALRVRKVLE